VNGSEAAAAAVPSFAPLLAVLVLVLALIPVAVWLLKRIGPAAATGAAGMRIVATLPLGPRERVIIVEAGERWWLLGVSAAGIQRIGTLPRGDLPAAATPAGFAALMAQARQRIGGR
jgi:flagellar protein FliO/FliZ